jgi:hypothetical protein
MLSMTRNARRNSAITDSNVAKVFAAYPDAIRTKLMTLRAMILEAAKAIDGVGPLEETLKWGQPSYLTTESGTGSTIRIDRVKSDSDRIAMYFHCQTDLVETFRELYPTQMDYGGNRSILFDAKTKIPEKALRHCIGLALTYHARKGNPVKKTGSASTAVQKKKRQPVKPKSIKSKTRALRTRRAPRS